MNTIYTQQETLREQLKARRKKYGSSSVQVFKTILELKRRFNYNKYEDVELWKERTLSHGSFCNLNL